MGVKMQNLRSMVDLRTRNTTVFKVLLQTNGKDVITLATKYLFEGRGLGEGFGGGVVYCVIRKPNFGGHVCYVVVTRRINHVLAFI